MHIHNLINKSVDFAIDANYAPETEEALLPEAEGTESQLELRAQSVLLEQVAEASDKAINDLIHTPVQETKPTATPSIDFANNPKGWPALHYAIEQGKIDDAMSLARLYPDEIQLLTPPREIEYFVGATTKIYRDEGYSALELAVKSSAKELVALLLQKGAKPSQTRKEHYNITGDGSVSPYRTYSPLYWAITQKNGPTIELLRSFGATLDPVFSETTFEMQKRVDLHKGALCIAVETGAKEIIETILGYTVTNKTLSILKKYELNKQKWPALNQAISDGDWQAFELLLPHKEGFLYNNLSGFSCFELAMWYEDQRFAEALIAHGYPKELALDSAVKTCNVTWLKKLASQEIPHNGALSLAVTMHDGELVKHLYALGYRDPKALSIAIHENQLAIALQLLSLEQHALKSTPSDIIDYKNNPYGWPSLHYAISQGHLEAAKELLKLHPEEIELFTPALEGEFGNQFYPRKLQNTNGYSALELAVLSGSAELVELLLERGANPSVERMESILLDKRFPDSSVLYTPLYWAIVQKNQKMVALLCAHGASLDPVFCHSKSQNDMFRKLVGEKKSALRIALESGTREIIETLFGTKISDDTLKILTQYEMNQRNWPALHLAIEEGNWQVFELLVRIKDGFTHNKNCPHSCFELAMQKSDPRFANSLIEHGYAQEKAFQSAIFAKNAHWMKRLASPNRPHNYALSTAIRMHDRDLVQQLYQLGYRYSQAIDLALEEGQFAIFLDLMRHELQTKPLTSTHQEEKGKSTSELLIEFTNNPKGWPGLHYAIEQGRFDVAEAFVHFYPEQIQLFTTPFAFAYSWETKYNSYHGTHHDTGYSALELAIKAGSKELVELLIKTGANPSLQRLEHFGLAFDGLDSANSRIFTPIFWAIVKHDRQMVTQLMATGASLDNVFVSNRGMNKSALQVALTLDARDITECIVGQALTDEAYELLKKYEGNEQNKPALNQALEKGDWQAFTLLLSLQKTPTFPPSCFELAIKQANARFAEALLTHGYAKNLALDCAVKEKNSVWMKKLASSDLPHAGALAAAIKLHDSELVSHLYSLGYRDLRAIAFALDEQQFQMALTLIANEPATAQRTEQIQRGCLLAIQKDDRDLFAQFYAYNALPHASALTQAISEKRLSIVTDLLKKNIQVELTHYTQCVELGHLDLLTMLVQATPMNENVRAQCIKRAIDMKNEAILSYLFEIKI